MEIQAPCTPGRSVASSTHHDGIVLMDLARGRLFASNRTGAQIWQGLEQKRPAAVIAAGLSRDHEIPFETAQAWVTTFLSQLVAHKLVRVGQ